MSLPELSAILVTRDSPATIRRALSFLQRQTAAARLELVLVAPRLEDAALPPEALAGFHSVQTIAVGQIRTREQAGAAGVRAARAPAVVFVEDHVYVAPDWAEALMSAHQGDWAAVGPLVENACPGQLSLACHLADYGHWFDPTMGGPVPLLSNSNSSYKRAALLALPGALEDWLDHQPRLQRYLLEHGQRMLYEPRARLWHLEFSELRGWSVQRFDDGWAFGAARSPGWPIARRLLYVLGAPLIPLVNLRRLLGMAQRTGTQGSALLRLLPALVLLVVIQACGELAGYWFAAAAADDRLHEREFDRLRFISRHDLRTLDERLAQVVPPLPTPSLAAVPAALPAAAPA